MFVITDIFILDYILKNVVKARKHELLLRMGGVRQARAIVQLKGDA